jgi:hypothetical protein
VCQTRREGGSSIGVREEVGVDVDAPRGSHLEVDARDGAPNSAKRGNIGPVKGLPWLKPWPGGKGMV